MFNLTIETSNAAFVADPLELQRLIKNVANRVARAEVACQGPVIDTNGNTCGSWTYEPDLGEA